MSAKVLQLEEEHSYSYNKSICPFPESIREKTKPPESLNYLPDSSELFVTKEEVVDIDEQMRRHLDCYKKVERLIVVNFYTGGGPFRRGVLDAIYRGHNPLNP